MLVIKNNCKSICVLTLRCFECAGEAAAPLMAVIEPSPLTNDMNSFVTLHHCSCDGSSDYCPLQLIGGQQTCRGDEGRWWRDSDVSALALG